MAKRGIKEYHTSTEDLFWKLIHTTNPVTRSVIRGIIVRRMLK